MPFAFRNGQFVEIGEEPDEESPEGGWAFRDGEFVRIGGGPISPEDLTDEQREELRGIAEGMEPDAEEYQGPTMRAAEEDLQGYEFRDGWWNRAPDRSDEPVKPDELTGEQEQSLRETAERHEPEAEPPSPGMRAIEPGEFTEPTMRALQPGEDDEGPSMRRLGRREAQRSASHWDLPAEMRGRSDDETPRSFLEATRQRTEDWSLALRDYASRVKSHAVERSVNVGEAFIAPFEGNEDVSWWRKVLRTHASTPLPTSLPAGGLLSLGEEPVETGMRHIQDILPWDALSAVVGTLVQPENTRGPEEALLRTLSPDRFGEPAYLRIPMSNRAKLTMARWARNAPAGVYEGLMEGAGQAGAALGFVGEAIMDPEAIVTGLGTMGSFGRLPRTSTMRRIMPDLMTAAAKASNVGDDVAQAANEAAQRVLKEVTRPGTSIDDPRHVEAVVAGVPDSLDHWKVAIREAAVDAGADEDTAARFADRAVAGVQQEFKPGFRAGAPLGTQRRVATEDIPPRPLKYWEQDTLEGDINRGMQRWQKRTAAARENIPGGYDEVADINAPKYDPTDAINSRIADAETRLREVDNAYRQLMDEVGVGTPLPDDPEDIARALEDELSGTLEREADETVEGWLSRAQQQLESRLGQQQAARNVAEEAQQVRTGPEHFGAPDYAGPQPAARAPLEDVWPLTEDSAYDDVMSAAQRVDEMWRGGRDSDQQGLYHMLKEENDRIRARQKELEIQRGHNKRWSTVPELKMEYDLLEQERRRIQQALKPGIKRGIGQRTSAEFDRMRWGTSAKKPNALPGEKAHMTLKQIEKNDPQLAQQLRQSPETPWHFLALGRNTTTSDLKEAAYRWINNPEPQSQGINPHMDSFQEWAGDNLNHEQTEWVEQWMDGVLEEQGGLLGESISDMRTSLSESYEQAMRLSPEELRDEIDQMNRAVSRVDEQIDETRNLLNDPDAPEDLKDELRQILDDTLIPQRDDLHADIEQTEKTLNDIEAGKPVDEILGEADEAEETSGWRPQEERQRDKLSKIQLRRKQIRRGRQYFADQRADRARELLRKARRARGVAEEPIEEALPTGALRDDVVSAIQRLREREGEAMDTLQEAELLAQRKSRLQKQIDDLVDTRENYSSEALARKWEELDRAADLRDAARKVDEVQQVTIWERLKRTFSEGRVDSPWIAQGAGVPRHGIDMYRNVYRESNRWHYNTQREIDRLLTNLDSAERRTISELIASGPHETMSEMGALPAGSSIDYSPEDIVRIAYARIRGSGNAPANPSRYVDDALRTADSEVWHPLDAVDTDELPQDIAKVVNRAREFMDYYYGLWHGQSRIPVEGKDPWGTWEGLKQIGQEFAQYANRWEMGDLGTTYVPMFSVQQGDQALIRAAQEGYDTGLIGPLFKESNVMRHSDHAVITDRTAAVATQGRPGAPSISETAQMARKDIGELLQHYTYWGKRLHFQRGMHKHIQDAYPRASWLYENDPDALEEMWNAGWRPLKWDPENATETFDFDEYVRRWVDNDAENAPEGWGVVQGAEDFLLPPSVRHMWQSKHHAQRAEGLFRIWRNLWRPLQPVALMSFSFLQAQGIEQAFNAVMAGIAPLVKSETDALTKSPFWNGFHYAARAVTQDMADSFKRAGAKTWKGKADEAVVMGSEWLGRQSEYMMDRLRPTLGRIIEMPNHPDQDMDEIIDGYIQELNKSDVKMGFGKWLQESVDISGDSWLDHLHGKVGAAGRSMKDATEGISTFIFGIDTIGRCSAYVALREAGESPRSARKILETVSVEYGKEMYSTFDLYANSVLWFYRYSRHRFEQMAHWAASRPYLGPMTAAAHNWMWDRETTEKQRVLLQGRSNWLKASPEYYPFRYDEIEQMAPYLGQWVNDLRPTSTIAQVEGGGSQFFMRIRIPTPEEVGGARDWVTDPVGTAMGQIPFAREMQRATKYQDPMGAAERIPAVGAGVRRWSELGARAALPWSQFSAQPEQLPRLRERAIERLPAKYKSGDEPSGRIGRKYVQDKMKQMLAMERVKQLGISAHLEPVDDMIRNLSTEQLEELKSMTSGAERTQIVNELRTRD